MIRIRDTLAGEKIRFHCVESNADLAEVREFIRDHRWLAFDTESTGLNCYRPQWKLRTAQFGDRFDSYVVPARYRKTISWTMQQPIMWIGHNGPHDVRCIERHLGYQTGVQVAGETYIPAHHYDSRNQREGGSGHGLKELSIALIDPMAGKWETNLKKAFKEIYIPMPGEFYKSGPKKGQPKFRKAKLSEGWELISFDHPAYMAYAAADPILTWRVWEYEQEQGWVTDYLDLYRFDRRLQEACSELQRRAMLLDVSYTKRLSAAYQKKVSQTSHRLYKEFGLTKINSPAQVADILENLGAKLTEKTDTGQYQTSAEILRRLLTDPYTNAKVRYFIQMLLVAKQVEKRRVAYTESMLRERDEDDRIHPSINSLAARTARMSVSGPPLQQLPTKDHEDELMWESEEELM